MTELAPSCSCLASTCQKRFSPRNLEVVNKSDRKGVNTEICFCVCAVLRRMTGLGGDFGIERKRRVNLVNGVDPQLEGHSPGELVPVTSGGNVVGVDLALDVDVLVGCYVKELDSNQRLRVVHLGNRQNTLIQAHLNLELLFGYETVSYLSFLAIVRVIHEVESAIWWEVPQLPYFVRIFSLRA